MTVRWTALALVGFAATLHAQDRKTPTPTPKPAQPVAPAKAETTPPARPAKSTARQRRQRWEQALQAPAQLHLGDRDEITLGELLQEIRRQRGLPVRIDAPHVLPLAAILEDGAAPSVIASRRNDYAAPAGLGIAPPLLSSVATLNSVAPVAVAVTNDSPPAEAPVVAPLGPQPVDSPQPIPSPTADHPDLHAIPRSVPSPSSESEDDSGPLPAVPDRKSLLRTVLEHSVSLSELKDDEATVEDVLRHALNSAVPLQFAFNMAMAEELPIPASITRAAEWELVVQDDGVLLTTKLNASMMKDVRVYRVSHLERSLDLKPEMLARTIARTVRPWSWRTTFDDPNQASPAPLPLPSALRKQSPLKMNFDVGSLLGGEPASNIRLANETEESPSPAEESKWELTGEDLTLMKRVWDGLFQGTVSTIQVIHHAEPPTGVIETLPGLLIITQSQAVHREIDDLLEQLATAGE